VTGSVLGDATLDSADAWYLRWATWTGTSSGFNWKDVSFTLHDFSATSTNVPEPSTFAALIGLLCTGTVGFVIRRRKRNLA
jgi:hypothetical protein